MSLKVLLLNPPGKQVYLRDYYCSKVSKANYVPHPVDLLMLSGRLMERYELKVIDALVDKLTETACITLVETYAPDVIISLIAAVSLDEDCALLARLIRPDRRIMVSGDVVLADTEAWLEQHSFVDAVLLDFTSEDIIPYIGGADGPFENVITRQKGIPATLRARPVNLEFTLPVPRHELFHSRHYRYPFVRHKQFATVLTDYGCAYKCSFCIMNTIGYKYRPVNNVLDELRFLKKLGKKEIYFSDQSFGINVHRALALCRGMHDEKFNFGWACFSRADLLTGELLTAMQEAGCHTILMGVEAGSDDVLRKYGKGCSLARVKEAFRECRSRKIRTVATFILGLPDETAETAHATIDFARELDPDFASFNIAVPRMSTNLRQEAIQHGLIASDLMIMDQTGSNIAMPSRHLTKEQLKDLSIEAIRGFYFRPGYLMRRAVSISSWYELSEHLSEGYALWKGLRKKAGTGV